MIALRFNPIDQRLDIVLNICRLIVRNLTLEEQQNLINKYASVLNEQVSEFDAIFVMNLFIPLRQNVDFIINLNLLQNLHNLAFNNNYLNIRLITHKFIAVILNKINDNDELFLRILSYFKEKINNNLNLNVNTEIMKAAVSLQVWLTKAIITKGSCDVEIFLNEVRKNFCYF